MHEKDLQKTHILSEIATYLVCIDRGQYQDFRVRKYIIIKNEKPAFENVVE